MSDDLLMRAIAWRNGDDTGLSSIALVSHFMGWPNPGRSKGDSTRHPDDSDAFGRCSRLLKAFPEFRERLDEARSLSIHWNAIIEHWDELEALYGGIGTTEGWRAFRDRLDTILDVLCYTGCGELEWSDETTARCAKCGSEVRRRDPRLPKPQLQEVPKPVTVPESIREHLIAGYLLIDNEAGEVIGQSEDCSECDGEGTVECVCDECDDEHEKDCKACDGTGSRGVTYDFESEPEVGEGETAIIAIFDKRNICGPRIAYETPERAQHALKILLEQPDSVISGMFTERKAA